MSLKVKCNKKTK